MAHTYRRQDPRGLLVLQKASPPMIKKSEAFCLVIHLPARQLFSAGGVFLREDPEHWERLTSNGAVVRCHTHYEAEEARNLIWEGVLQGQWKDVQIEPYDPQPSDLPYHDWIRGKRGERLARLGIPEQALPEEQDPDLIKLSDEEWLTFGPE